MELSAGSVVSLHFAWLSWLFKLKDMMPYVENSEWREMQQMIGKKNEWLKMRMKEVEDVWRDAQSQHLGRASSCIPLHRKSESDPGRLAPALASCWTPPTWGRLHRNRTSPPFPLTYLHPYPQEFIGARLCRLLCLLCLIIFCLPLSLISPSVPGLSLNYNPGQTHSWLLSVPTVR